MRIVVGEAREPGAVEVMTDHVLDGPPRHVAHAQAVGRVLPHRHPGEDRVALKHHRVLRAVGAGRHVDLDRSGGGGLQPGEDAQQRRLAAPGRADDREELAARDVERDIVDGDQAAEGLDEITDADRRAPGTASAIAFMTAASAAVVPASPAPLTPSGLVVAGTTMSPIVNAAGMSVARGSPKRRKKPPTTGPWSLSW